MAYATLPIAVAGALGTNAGAGSDGVLFGLLTADDPDAAILQTQALAGLCYTDDGGVYVNETTPFGEATGDDVEVLPATPAVDDAVYYGHATKTFGEVVQNLTTQGDGVWTIVYEYWDGDSYEDLSNVTDGTTMFEAATGWRSLTFDIPEDWAKNTVDGVLAYWIRMRVSEYTSVATAPQVGQGYIVATADPDFTDDTTDFTDAGASDVALLPAYPLVGDGFYVVYSEKYCKVKVTIGQERTGTATLAPYYWNGSAYAALTTYDDDSAGWSTGTSTYLISFVPPSDWVACTAENGPNAETGFSIFMKMTALTDVTQQPLATQGWVYPLSTGGAGIISPVAGSSVRITCNALTASGSTQDSTLLVVNVTKGTCVSTAWTKATAHYTANVSLAVSLNDKIALVQVTEDGTTEFADASICLMVQT